MEKLQAEREQVECSPSYPSLFVCGRKEGGDEVKGLRARASGERCVEDELMSWFRFRLILNGRGGG